MPLDRYLVNDALSALASDHGVELDDDTLNELAHHVADVLDGAQTARPRPVAEWPDPDVVGASEYRAIHEVCEDVEDLDLLASTLRQFIDTATALLSGRLSRTADPASDDTEDTCSGCGCAYDPGADHCRFCEDDDDTAPCVCGYQAEPTQGSTATPDPPHPTTPVAGRRQP
jgi:hypothetical protein